MKEKNKVLSVNNLRVSFKTDHGIVHAVRGVSFDLYQGETLCIVGESGSGKSVTSKTIMGILSPSAMIEEGSIYFQGEDLTKVSEEEFHHQRKEDRNDLPGSSFLSQSDHENRKTDHREHAYQQEHAQQVI